MGIGNEGSAGRHTSPRPRFAYPLATKKKKRWNTLTKNQKKIKNTTDDLNLRHIMHKRGERRSQRASTMSFNSVSEAEKCIEMSLKWSFFSGGEEEGEEEEGGVIRWCSSTFLDRRRPKHQVWSRKRNREVLASTKDQHKVCVSGANKVRNLKILGNRFTARCRSSPPGCSSTKTNHLPAGASAGSQQG